MKLIEEKLKEFFLQNITEECKSEVFTGWKIIGSINVEGRTFNKPIILKTNQDAWVNEFKIVLLNGGESLIVAVSLECPEVYSIIPEEILDKLTKIIAYQPLTNEDLVYFYKKLGGGYCIDPALDDINYRIDTTITGVNNVFWDKYTKTITIN